MLENSLKFKGKDAWVSGFTEQPLFKQEMSAGRWYTPGEAASGAHVAVIAKNLARVTGTHVGDTVSFKTASGPALQRSSVRPRANGTTGSASTSRCER